MNSMNWFKIGFYAVAAISLSLVGFMVGRSCSSRGGAPLPSPVPITREEFLKIGNDLAQLRKLLESRQGETQTVIRTVILRDTIYGEGIGERRADTFAYQDKRLWFWANLATDSVRYAISPIRIGLLLSKQGNLVRSVAYDLDDSTALISDSVFWSEERPLITKSISIGCYYPWEPFGRAELEFGRLGLVGETGWRDGMRARAGIYWRF